MPSPIAQLTTIQFSTRTLFLATSVAAVAIAVVAPFLRRVGADAPERLGWFVAGAAAAVVGGIALRVPHRRGEPAALHQLRIPLRDPLSFGARLFRVFFYTIITAFFVGTMVQAEEGGFSAFLGGGLIVTAIHGVVHELLFDPEYNHATFYPDFLRIGARESHRWKNLSARWTRVDGDHQMLDILLATPRTTREICLRAPLDKVEEIQRFFTEKVIEQLYESDGPT